MRPIDIVLKDAGITYEQTRWNFKRVIKEPLINSGWWDCCSKASDTRRRSQLIVGY